VESDVHFYRLVELKKFRECNVIPHLIHGDIVHVPFTPEEQLFVIRSIAERLALFFDLQRNAVPMSTIEEFRSDLSKISRYLPGRSEDDCLRWLRSFVNQRFYQLHPEELPETDAELYEAQNTLLVYTPKESSVLLSTNHSTLKRAGMDKLLLLRDINGLTTQTYKTKAFKTARHKGFALNYTVAGATSEIIDVKIDPSGRKQLAICSSKTPKELLLFDMATKKYKTLEGHDKTVSRIVYTCNGDKLVSASYDKTLKVWETKSGALLHTFEKRTVTETNIDGTTYQTELPGHKGSIVSVAHGAYDYDNILVSADNEGGLFVWDLARMEVMADASLRRDYPNPQWPGPILEMEFVGGLHPEWFISGTDNVDSTGPGVVQLWDVSQTRMLHCFQDCKRYVSCLRGNMDGNLVICGSADQKCYLYDLRSQELVKTLQTSLEGDLDVNAVTFSPCERFVTCSGEDNQTLVFDRRNYELLHILCHTRPAAYQARQGVTSAKWVSGTNLLLTGGEDGVNLWDLELSKPLVNSYKSHTAPVSCLESSEYYVVSGGDDGLVNIYSDRSFS